MAEDTPQSLHAKAEATLTASCINSTLQSTAKKKKARAFTQKHKKESEKSQAGARVLQKRIQHVIEQGKAPFGGFQALLDGGVDEALRDEAGERRAQVI